MRLSCSQIAYSWQPTWNNCQVPAKPQQRNDFINSKLIKKKSKKFYSWTVRVLSNQNFPFFSFFSSKVKNFELFRPAITFQESVLKRKEWKILAGYKYTHLKIPSNSFDETKIYSFSKIILHWVRSVPAVCTRSKGRDVNGMAAKKLYLLPQNLKRRTIKNSFCSYGEWSMEIENMGIYIRITSLPNVP